jgi:hypothetical protein
VNLVTVLSGGVVMIVPLKQGVNEMSDVELLVRLIENEKKKMDFHDSALTCCRFNLEKYTHELNGHLADMLNTTCDNSDAPEKQDTITDANDLRIGDIVEITGSPQEGWVRIRGKEMTVFRIGNVVKAYSGNIGWSLIGGTEWKFIRRP